MYRVQVLFCVYWADTIYIVDRKIVYLGPKAETQLEGRLALPSNEKALLMGPCMLPWHHAILLLEAGELVPSADDGEDDVKAGASHDAGAGRAGAPHESEGK
jgi:hypothetical protein